MPIASITLSVVFVLAGIIGDASNLFFNCLVTFLCSSMHSRICALGYFNIYGVHDGDFGKVVHTCGK
jgi:hypothetical protein